MKDALIDNRSKLGEAQTLQQFSRDADEMENWLQEKLQIASDESYKDPANIQVGVFIVQYNRVIDIVIRSRKLNSLESR